MIPTKLSESRPPNSFPADAVLPADFALAIFSGYN
jgi:hypothetical protein